MELAIVKYIKEHGLAKALKEFKLKSNVCDTKILLKYDQIESPMGLEEVQDCRGLILERDTWKVMSLAFRKFFNTEEGHAARIDWNTARVLEKVDGSLIQLYWDWNDERWCVGTTGTPEADGEVNNKFGTTFADLFWNTIKKVSPKFEGDLGFLVKGYTYAFELMTPYNIVVKPHETSTVTLLGVRKVETLGELGYDALRLVSDQIGVPLVKSFDINAMDAGALKRTFEGMPWTEEGYVVVDANFNRVKIKNPAYVAVHHLKSKTAEHNIMGVVKSNEIEEFASTFPERREEIFKLKEEYDKLVATLEATWEELKTRLPKSIEAKERKKYAEAVFEVTTRNGVKDFNGLFFGLKDGKTESVKDFMFDYDNRKLYKRL
jgi:hypothetical protein